MNTEKEKDNWNNRSVKMSCATCMHYLNFRCRRNAPTIKGFPAVYPSDYCGEHKLDKEQMKKDMRDMEGVILK
jgi:hypothetical protein